MTGRSQGDLYFIRTQLQQLSRVQSIYDGLGPSGRLRCTRHLDQALQVQAGLPEPAGLADSAIYRNRTGLARAHLDRGHGNPANTQRHPMTKLASPNIGESLLRCTN